MPSFACAKWLFTGLIVAVAVGGLTDRITGQDASIELLVERLKGSRSAPKVSAARSLAELGQSAHSAVPVLTSCLSDPTDDVRVVAAYALSQVSIDFPSSIAALQAALSDPSEHVRYSAQWSTAHLARQIPLDQAEPQRARIIELLNTSQKLFKGQDHQLRHLAALESVLETLRSQVAQEQLAQKIEPEPPLADEVGLKIDPADLVEGLYESQDLISRMQVIKRLSDQQKFPIAIRKNVLKFEASQLDERFAVGLLNYANAQWGESTQAVLVELLSDIVSDAVLPEYAYQLVELLMPTDQAILDQLYNWCQDTRQPLEVRIAAIKALSQTRHNQPACVDWLASLLTDTELQMYVADALYDLGQVARSAEAPLLSALSQSPDESFQLAGLRAINQIAGESTTAIQFVVAWMAATPSDSHMLPPLLDSCAQFGVRASSALPIIQKHLQNSNAETRLAAAKALQHFPGMAESALPQLIEMLTTPNEEEFIKPTVARTIGKIGPAGTELLVRSIGSSSDPAIQMDLIRALAAAGVDTIEAQLVCVDFLKNQAAPIDLRIVAANTLGVMGQAAQPSVNHLLHLCKPEQDASLQAMCLLAAAQIDPSAARPSIELALNHDSVHVRANAAFAMHLCGESRIAFDTLLAMLDESDADFTIKEALRDMGDSIATFAIEQAENSELYDVQRLACCELACEMANPDWRRLLLLVEEPVLGERFANQLSFYWHPDIASQMDQHLPEVDALLELSQSSRISAVGRARLAFLLSPDGLGAGGDDEYWGGLALMQPSAIQSLQQANELYAAPEMAMASPEIQPPSIDKKREALEIAAVEEATPREPVGGSAVQLPVRQVEVHYGTNRQRESLSSTIKSAIISVLLVTLIGALALIYCAVSFFGRGRRLISFASLVGMIMLGSVGMTAAKQLSRSGFESRVGYNHRFSNAIEYGTCTVSIPPNHQPGVVESPVLWKAQLVLDPNKHVVLEQVKPLSSEDFFASIKRTQLRNGKNLLVFIHGYNVSFDDAAKRTAQMAFDLEFPGASVFYSWPSQADWYSYKTDKRQIEMSIDHIKNFLEDLAEKSRADTINLVAHSMGNVGLMAALQEISSPSDRPLFNQVVLAAPDIDAEVFKREIAPKIVSKANRTTLYTSKTDLALIASRFFNKGNRVGDAGPELITFPGIETIDATSVDSSLLGHSYYGSNINVLTDVGQLLRNKPIDGRSYLRKVVGDNADYWTFDPVLISRTNSQSLFPSLSFD